ncbi:MAG TPA: NADH-quinone oxidoreductase subunit C, partial [Bacillus bacterium]|nr:NADH-quinone oxidoreductase subunit C [Bacillus sp. (in: firmicutes)]
MSGEKDLDQIKREAAEKAKELAKQRLAAKQSGEGSAQNQSSEKTDKPEVKQNEAPAVPEVPASDEDGDLAKRKAAAAAKAKAAAAAKMKSKGQAEGAEAPASDDDADLAKKKAAAVAKAKAAAAAKMKAKGQAEEGADSSAGDDDADLAKKKAAAVAKAKAAAAAKAKAAAAGGSADDEKAKAIAAAKAKAAAAMKAKAAAGAKTEEPAEEKKPSPNQPYLDKYVKAITDNLGEDVLEDYYINTLSKDVPTLVAKADSYHRLAAFLKYNELLGFDYLSELHGTDFETHMEVYVHLYSYKNRQSVAL